MSVVTKTIEVLQDGKLKAIDSRNKTVYIQPVIVVDRLSNSITVSGSDGENIDVNIAVTTIDGVSFSGDIDALEVALRNMAAKANGILNAGTGSGSDVAKETKQDTQIDQHDLEENGYIIDLTADDQGNWAGFPMLLGGSPAIKVQTISEDTTIEYETEPSNIADAAQLAEVLNTYQQEYYFEATTTGAEKLLVKSGTKGFPDLVILTIVEDGAGDLEYLSSAMTATAEASDSNSKQSLLELQAVKQAIKATNAENKAAFTDINTNLTNINKGVKKGTASTTTQVASSLTVVTLKAANTNRVSLKIFNSGANVLLIKEGSAATLTDYTYKLDAANAALLPFVKISDYTGVVTGIWDVATGDAKVTETV